MAQILIVEDEANIRRVLRKILVDFDKNINISEAADGLEAISMVDNNLYDLVLCDIKMPKKDGIEVLEHIQKVSQQTASGYWIYLWSLIYFWIGQSLATPTH